MLLIVVLGRLAGREHGIGARRAASAQTIARRSSVIRRLLTLLAAALSLRVAP